MVGICRMRPNQSDTGTSYRKVGYEAQPKRRPPRRAYASPRWPLAPAGITPTSRARRSEHPPERRARRTMVLSKGEQRRGVPAREATAHLLSLALQVGRRGEAHSLNRETRGQEHAVAWVCHRERADAGIQPRSDFLCARCAAGDANDRRECPPFGATGEPCTPPRSGELETSSGCDSVTRRVNWKDQDGACR